MRRTLLIGASSGIGRALASQILARGDAAVLAARRGGPLQELIGLAPDPTVALARSCDVADPAACAALVDAATAFLEPHGGIDTVMYAAGTAPLGPLSGTTADQWHELLATNVVGAALVLAQALPSLRRHPGRATAVLLSSHSVGDPWPGLVPYAASKAALNELALGLRSEEPALRTIRVAVGPTSTSFADGWDPETASGFLGGWAERGYLRHTILEPAETAAMVLAALDDPDAPDDLSVIGAEAP